MRIYTDLAEWYPLLTPRAEYEEEAAIYRGQLPAGGKLLELGAGAGHNAYFLADRFALTLVDLSPKMLAFAAANCPDAVCLVGDMRTFRTDATFDAVFVHDAIGYMLTEADLAAAMQTAFVHLRPGGVALFTPDCVAETFEPGVTCGGSDGDGRAMRYLEWSWQRAGETDRTVCDYTLSLREGEEEPRLVNDRHEEGLFPRATWLRLLAAAGFEARLVEQPHDDHVFQLFVATRPG